MRVWSDQAVNYFGELVTVAPITKDPKLSLWTMEGLTLPDTITQFYEQLAADGEVITMIRWKPEPKKKTPDEVHP